MERDIPHPVADAPGASELRAHWWESLRTRLLLWSTLTSTLLLVGVTALFYVGIRAVLIDDARGQMHSLAEQTTKGLNSTMDSAQHVARTLAASITSIGVEHDNLRALLRASVHADADISGATLIIEPGVLAPDDPGFNFHIRRKDGGYEEEAIEDDDLDYDYRQTPGFIRTTTTSEPWWSEPHIDELSGDVLVTTYNLALRRDGESATAAGMVSVDVPIARLRPSLAGIPASRNIRAVLLSPERLLVLHPDPQLEMKQSLDELVLEKGRGDLAPMLEALRQHKSVEFRHEAPPSQDAPDGETRYSFAIPVNGTGWAFALSVSQNYVLARFHRITMWVGLAALLAVLVSVLVARRFANLIAQPIEDLTGTARHFADGEFDYPLPHLERLDEVGVMARAFESARDSIKRQLTEITEMGAARARAESELDIARDIQLAMLPSGNELDVGESHLDMDGLLEPAKAVGGDFYNFFEREGYALWFVVGDVSDKGVPAALFMARTTTVLGVAAQLGGSPGHALMEAARHLVEGNETCMFATVLCGVIELRTGALSLASAGHEAPILLRADGRRQLLPVPTAPPLGVDVAGDYPIWRGRMMPGDTLFTFTDGITEAFNRDNEPFGMERLLDSLDPDLDARRQCQEVVARVHEFAGDTAQSDDITALAIRYRRDTHGRERSSARIALRTPLPADPVGHMIAQVDATLAERHLPAETMDDVHLVVEEIVTNIVNHGTDERRDLVLALELAADAQRLTLEFHDNCRPFDPTSLPAPDLDADIADRPLGGLGVSLVRSLAEQFVYARINNKNVLRVVLPVPSPKDST